MLKRSYEIFTVDLHTLSIFGAWQTDSGKRNEKKCVFTYEQSMILPLAQKGNTILFEQLSEVAGLSYGLSDNPSSCFLYDILFVDMIPEKEETQVCFLDEKRKAVSVMDSSEAREWLYMEGFSITGVPERGPDGKRSPKTDRTPVETIRYRAFVASASMARKGMMLFVNEKVYGELMRRLTLDFFDYDGEKHHLRMPTEPDESHPERPYFKPHYRVSAAKLSAYLGLMLSDGVTLREKEALWKNGFGTAAVLPELNEKTVFVADDLNTNAGPFYVQNGPYAWRIEAEDQPAGKPGQPGNKLEVFFEALSDPEKRKESRDADALKTICEKWKQGANAYMKDGIPERACALPGPGEGEGPEGFAFKWGLALVCRMGFRPMAGLRETLEACIDSIRTSDTAWDTLCHLAENPSALTLSVRRLQEVSEKQKKKCLKGDDDLPCQVELSRKKKTFRCRLKPTGAAEDGKAGPETVNLFDGIGLCDHETFDRMEELLLQKPVDREHPQNRRYSALIIRLPWIKGLIVRCDFRQFFAEQARETGIPLPETIRDAFGESRRLKDIHLIINKSMLKGYKYLVNLKRSDEGDAPWDRWKYYWDKIREYGISLLIAGRHSREGQRVPMNYQFLSTAGLRDEDIQALIDKNAARQQQLLYLEEKTIQDSFPATGEDDPREEAGETAGEDDYEAEETPPFTDAPTDIDSIFGRGLKYDEGLLKTKYAQKAVQSHGRSALLDAMRGRIEVDGDYRLIAPDLVAMLYFLYDRYVSEIPFDAERYQPRSRINFPTGNAYSGHGYYYAPGRNTPWEQENGQTEIVALRNPHYALGEGAITSPLPKEERRMYDRYFGHLSSVIMLPASAVATMGGADFDGDRAAVVCEPSVLESVKRAIRKNHQETERLLRDRNRYTARFAAAAEGQAGLKEVEFIQGLQLWMERSLPDTVIEAREWHEGYGIPLIFGDSQAAAIDFSCREPNMEAYLLESFVNTTRQRIGILSVEALKYASIAYQNEPEHQEGANPQEPAEGKLSAEEIQCLRDCLWNWRMISLSLENGVEIDMAKTGISCNPAPLRRAAILGKNPGKNRSDVEDLLAVEDSAFSLMREYDVAQRESEVHYQTGKKLTGALKSLVRQDNLKLEQRSRRLKAERHNAVNLIPEMCYEAAIRIRENDGTEKNHFPNPRGITLQNYLLNGTRSSQEKKREDRKDRERKQVLEEAMRDLAWAKNRERAEKLGRYIAEQCGLEEESRARLTAFLRERKELTDSEQGVYLFKELMKYLYQTTQFTKSPKMLEEEIPKTPEMLRRMLLEKARGDRTLLMRFLCSCDTVHYDSRADRWADDMTDYLFLSLAGEDFVRACREHTRFEPLPEDDPFFAEGRRLVAQYQEYKTQTSDHPAEIRKMRERYTYCLRNLQQRTSLAEALSIMKSYSQAYEQTPLAPYISIHSLRTLYTYLEDKPKKQGDEE